MDYREIENKLARNREMIREREYARMTKAILEANRPQRQSLWSRLGLWLTSLKWRKAAPRPRMPITSQTRLERP